MNNTIQKISLLALLVFSPLNSFAASDVWSDWYGIDKVYIYKTGTVFIMLENRSAHPNPAGCASTSWLVAPFDQVNVKEVYQMALTAKAAGLKINLHVSGSDCGGSYARINHAMTGD